MRAKEYELICRAVDEGVAYGWHRAHKHSETGERPADDQAIEIIALSVMNEILEWFEFPSKYDE